MQYSPNTLISLNHRQDRNDQALHDARSQFRCVRARLADDWSLERVLKLCILYGRWLAITRLQASFVQMATVIVDTERLPLINDFNIRPLLKFDIPNASTIIICCTVTIYSSINSLTIKIGSLLKWPFGCKMAAYVISIVLATAIS